MTVTGNFERFQYFNFETNFLKNDNILQKTGVILLAKKIEMENVNFRTKLPCQKPMLRQIEWGGSTK